MRPSSVAASPAYALPCSSVPSAPGCAYARDMALPFSPSSATSSGSLPGRSDSVSCFSFRKLRWRSRTCESSSLALPSIATSRYEGSNWPLSNGQLTQKGTPLRSREGGSVIRWRSKPGLLSPPLPRKSVVKARLETPDGTESTDALPYPGRDAIKFFLESSRSALIDKFKTNDVGREIAALAVPALLAQAADPAAQLVQTAYIGRLGTSLVVGVTPYNAFRNDELGMEIAIIALPAILALAADPLASLVDSAFIGRIGPVELAAVGVSISIFNLVSKMFNIPLLNVTTSFVAEDEVAEKSTTTLELDQVITEPQSSDDDKESLLLQTVLATICSAGPSAAHRRMLPAVSSSLVLGTALGLLEAAVLVFAAGPVLYVMGIPADSPMRLPAEQYLTLRAIGAPAVVLALAVQGVFRGFKDTKTPLYSTVAGNIVNIILDPILMFLLQYGVRGAAVATVISQYLIVILLLWSLNKRVVLLPPAWEDLKLERFLKSGGLLLGRTLAILATMTLATSMAARQGPIPMAAHQICLQIWLATSLLSDGLALAAQAILAGSFAEGDSKRTKEVASRILQMGLVFGVTMAIVLSVATGPMAGLFTTDEGVLKIVPYLIPFVAATQPINALAFVFDGLHYGASDFAYAAYSMILTAIPSIIVLLLAPRAFGLSGVWMGLTVVMTLRMAAGFARIGTASGPWRVLRENPDKENLQ